MDLYIHISVVEKTPNYILIPVSLHVSLGRFIDFLLCCTESCFVIECNECKAVILSRYASTLTVRSELCSPPHCPVLNQQRSVRAARCWRLTAIKTWARKHKPGLLSCFLCVGINPAVLTAGVTQGSDPGPIACHISTDTLAFDEPGAARRLWSL